MPHYRVLEPSRRDELSLLQSEIIAIHEHAIKEDPEEDAGECEISCASLSETVLRGGAPPKCHVWK